MKANTKLIKITQTHTILYILNKRIFGFFVISLTGLSMGGGGTVWLGLTHPDIRAAIVPVCPAPPAGSEELSADGNNLPIHGFKS